MSFYSTAGGSSDVIPPGGLYVGVVLEVGKEDPLRGYRGNVGAVRVSIQELGVTFDYTPVVRGPETNPYVKDDRVICAFLNSRLEEIVILGRINRLPIERMVGINVEEPAYPVHIGGQTTQYGVTLKIDPTSYSGSNRASIQMHETIMGAGATTTEEGDWYVYDNSNDQYDLHHSGHDNVVNGGLTVRATGTHTQGTAGTFVRYIQFSPTYDWSGYERGAFFTDNQYADFTFFGTVYQYSCHPASNNAYKLGHSGGRWSEVFAVNGTINTSDQNQKTDIADSDLGLDFVNALRPVKFKWIETEGRAGVRTHYGLLGQEVETVLGGVASDTAIWTNALIEAHPEMEADPERNVPHVAAVEEHYEQGLRYTELIAPLIKAVQELTARVEALEG
jgi:hypothetical protein